MNFPLNILIHFITVVYPEVPYNPGCHEKEIFASENANEHQHMSGDDYPYSQTPNPSRY